MHVVEARRPGGAHDALLEGFSDFLAERIGLHFPPPRHEELRQRMGEAARRFGQADAAACMRWLMSAPLGRERVETLASALTVGETYFFREPETFRAIEERILPALIRLRAARRRLRIWSAGCSTGEEPYSLAIVLDRMREALEGWEVTVLATDINPGFLRHGAQASYGEWSFRGTPPALKASHFRRAGANRYRLSPHLRERVSFSYLNLAEDAYPSLLTNTTAFDLILCRNVLMYFSPASIARIAARLRDALCEGGVLVLGAAETLLVEPEGMRVEQAGGARVLRKPAMAEAGLVREAPQARTARVDPPRQSAAPARVLTPAPLPVHEAETPQALAALARRHADTGDLDAALAFSRRALAADKLDPAAHYLHALIQIEIGRSHEGAQALQRALFLDRNFVMAHFTLAGLCLAQGRDDSARRHAGNARALLEGFAPEDPVPGAEGMNAGRLLTVLASMRERADGRG